MSNEFYDKHVAPFIKGWHKEGEAILRLAQKEGCVVRFLPITVEEVPSVVPGNKTFVVKQGYKMEKVEDRAEEALDWGNALRLILEEERELAEKEIKHLLAVESEAVVQFQSYEARQQLLAATKRLIEIRSIIQSLFNLNVVGHKPKI